MDTASRSKLADNDPPVEVIEKFEALLKIATQLQVERLKLHNSCKKWYNLTGQASKAIEEIQQKLVKVNHVTNCVSLGATTSAVIGTAMGITGTALALPTGGLSLLLTAGGSSAAVLGGGVFIGSCITKDKLSKSLCEQAKRAFDETKECAELLESHKTAYFDTLAMFKTSLGEIRESELMSMDFELNEWSSLAELNFDEGTKKKFPCVFSRTPKEVRSIEKRLLELIREIIRVILDDPLARRLFSIIGESGTLQNLFPDIDFSDIFHSAERRARLLLQGSVAVYHIVKDSRRSLAHVLKSMSTTIRIGIGFLNVFFLAWGMFDLITTSIEVNNGSKSTESEDLARVVREMEDCRKDLVTVVKELFDWDIQ